MAKGANQKLKVYYLMKILTELTDENHGLTMSQIIDELKRCGIEAERKSIYSDIESIRSLGIDVILTQEGRECRYSISEGVFELAELKLLVDAVWSSKFITYNKSKELVDKLVKFTSRYEAAKLDRQSIVCRKSKTINESIYYNVDAIHNAIGDNKQIVFKYLVWNTKKEYDEKKNGADYVVSPWALLWDNDYYYLVGFDEIDKKIKHYRVDKMRHINVSKENRNGKTQFSKLSIDEYAQRSFGMFGGEEVRVTLKVKNNMVGVIIDQFGKEIPIIDNKDGTFTTTVAVVLSDQFLGWMFALGNSVKITGPERVVVMMSDKINDLKNIYENG